MTTRRFSMLVAALAALVAAGSFVVAYRVLDGGDATSAPSAPAPDPTSPTSTVAPAETTSTTAAPITQPGDLDTPTWVVVVTSGTSRAEADATARRLATSGYRSGVLNSDDHSSLTKGLWVAYAGPYPDASAAQAAVDRLTAAGFIDTYPRCIGDKKDCNQSSEDD